MDFDLYRLEDYLITNLVVLMSREDLKLTM